VTDSIERNERPKSGKEDGEDGKLTDDEDTSDVENEETPESTADGLGYSLARVLSLSNYKQGESVSKNDGSERKKERRI